MAFPQRKYDDLSALADDWQVSLGEVQHCVETGQLQCCIWLNQICIEIGTIDYCENGRYIFVPDHEQYIEGFVGLRAQDCRKLFHDLRSHLTLFTSLDYDGLIQIADGSAVPVEADELVVLLDERHRFEKEHRISSTNTPVRVIKPTPFFHHNEDFTAVTIRSRHFRFGIIQSRIIAALYDAYQNDDPWVHGKILLRQAKSGSDSIRSAFKSQNHWREVIESNGKGLYRLNV